VKIIDEVKRELEKKFSVIKKLKAEIAAL